MTHREICEQIVIQGNCDGISCEEDNCPLHPDVSRFPHHGTGQSAEFAKQWLEEHKEGTMDKQAVMKRLDAIEREAQELRAIIEKPLVYDDTKIYIGVKDGEPHIMVGNIAHNYYRFHCFARQYKSEHGWSSPKNTGQECLDYHLNAGFEIREFDNTKEAFEYFMSFL